MAVVFYLCSYGLFYIEGTGAYTPIDLYKVNPAILDNNMQNFGLITSLRIDISQILFSRDDSDIENAFRKITYLVEKDEVSQEYIDACITYVKNKFEMSLQIINTDYYRIIYDSFEVE